VSSEPEPQAELPLPDEPKPREDVVEGLEAAAELRAPDAAELGRRAESPGQIPWAGWKAVMRRTARQMITDRASLVAAGCAFYATLALFPAISMLVFIYGLVFDPVTVEPQLQVLRELLPPSAFQLITDRVHMLVTKGYGTLGLGLVISTSVALWSAAAGTKSVIAALNMAYEEPERRSFLRYNATALGMTLCGVLGVSLAIATLVFLPALVDFLGLSAYAKTLIQVLSTTLMVGFVTVTLSLLYRFGPCRRMARWHWVTPGSLLATVLWLIASVLFSLYVGRVASYDVTYGPLGAVVGVMMWFYVTAYVVLLGAELNSELELQTARDSTEGPSKPLGRRGAYVADHIAEG
jgi:membrane protein